jgi:deoxyribodipyrimidine photo-lyase
METNYDKIITLVNNIDPVKYANTRNYIDGAVTRLSPYISRGVISTAYVLQNVLARGYQPHQIEKFIQELAWRDYYQQVWIAKGHDIDGDLQNNQYPITNKGIPNSILYADCNIRAIDNSIKLVMDSGYMHNHCRMYVAGIVCNMANSHWYTPAKWMYYYLYDADWASNALSWQWVAGSFSNKKYVANQENINKYCGTSQQNTWLDVPYETFDNWTVPNILKETTIPQFKTILPENVTLQLDNTLPTIIYNFYNLDLNWRNTQNANKILLLEPSHFEKYPVSANTISFIIALSKNINKIQIFVGEFMELKNKFQLNEIIFKEHPTTTHYIGTKDNRDWLCSNVTGYYPSFFGYWNKAQKQLMAL